MSLPLDSSSERMLLLQCPLFSTKYVEPDKLSWLMGSAFVIMALMSFGIGANDAANSEFLYPLTVSLYPSTLTDTSLIW